MKKIMFLVAAYAVMVACNNGKTTADNGGVGSAVQDSAATGNSAVYEGLTPTADVADTKYRVAPTEDSSNGFSVSESYIKSASKADTVYNYTDKYQVVKKNVKGKKNTHYQFKLGKDSKTNFLVVNDPTLRLISSDFKEPTISTKGMNYNLELK